MSLLGGLFLPTDAKSYFRFLPLNPAAAATQAAKDNFFASFGISADFELDILEGETNSKTWNVSDNIIEDGTSVADHRAAQPETLTVEFTFTDTPIGKVNGLSAIVKARRGRARELYKELETLAVSNDFSVTIVTGLKVYQNFVIQNLTANRSNDRANQVRVTAEFKQLRLFTEDGFTSLFVDDNILHSVGQSSALGLLQLKATSLFLESKIS